MADKIYLETSELESLASSIKENAQSIKDEYTNNCYSAIELGKSCIELSGLDVSKIFEILNNTYDSFTERCISLSNYITNTIIPNYNSASEAISSNFDSNLGNKINSLLGITSSSSNTTNSTSSISTVSSTSTSNSNSEINKSGSEFSSDNSNAFNKVTSLI